MRTIFGSEQVSSASGTAVQLETDSTLRVYEFQASLRMGVGSATPVYIGNDSGVSSANGFQLSSAGAAPTTFQATYPVLAGIFGGPKATQFYMNSSSTNGRMDFAMTVVP